MTETPTLPAVSRSRSIVTLVAVLLGFLTLPMLMSGTTVALPAIGVDLEASGAALQWVVVGYFLGAASLMLVAGSLGDRFGRRRVFAVGAAVYTAGALFSALAHDILVLDAARTLSGVGAAGVMACGGAILGATFVGPARTRAFAVMGTTAGLGLALGPSLSGWLVGELGWRGTFGTFAVVGLLLWTGTRFMAESRSAAPSKVDVPGTLLFIGAMALVMFGVNQAAGASWVALVVLLPIAVGLVLFVLFVLVERRTPAPLLDFTLLRDRRFLSWCLGCAVLASAPSTAMIFLPTYLQGVNGASAQATGLTMLMLSAPLLVMPQVGATLMNRFGVSPRIIVVTSLLLIAAGNAWLTVLQPGIGTAALAGPMATIGLGMGLAVGTVDAQAMNLVDRNRLGMAAGILNTVRTGSATLAATVVGTSMITLLQSRTGDADTAARIAAGNIPDAERAVHSAQYTEVWHLVLWTVAVVCVIAAATVWTLLIPSRSSHDAADRGAAVELSAVESDTPERGDPEQAVPEPQRV
ncbi:MULTISPECIES: MFS transporter [Actinoalloteichus]|uniref:Major Facilitator Superfamily transporter n=1 Tax=Actinoalloteichus fjordicus TaxID=1612552 RepID=A0AAC9LDN6_9PSEU|nr:MULTISPECIES: MFS transporter [Actinoalloteichus]APU14949.1 Major Facilitator Superfamily transporter [Actinoalloteichus fjordicus]APU21019.1 Major Facilitator Superfamily transporter [Actinoalloteichus sp. GBA129-24]